MTDYFPTADHWEHIAPAAAGFDRARLADAIDYAVAAEINTSNDLTEMIPKGDRHPNNRQLGPLKERSSAIGIILRGGYMLAHFGQINSVEVTFSVTKSYLSAVAGLAWDSGLLTDLDESVSKSVTDCGFAAPHNNKITWRHLLQQTSEWEGELFGLPDWIDRGRQVHSTAGMEAGTIGESASQAKDRRSLGPPGSFWEYNDVRVNRTALCLLRLFGKPLPEILDGKIMRPINASKTWAWHGYDTSWIEESGRRMQSVSGGAHWGGGMWINACDQARFGLLYQRRGRWGDQRVLSETWIDQTTSPCNLQPDYGLLWWLNHKRAMSDLACAKSFAARGAGGNVIFIEPEMDLVIVLRWCGDPKGVIDRIIASIY